MKYSRFLIFLFVIIAITSFADASINNPYHEIVTNGCYILTQGFTEVKQNVNFTFYFHVYNDTNFIENDSANCTFHLHSSVENGLHTFIKTSVPKFGLRDFEVFINETNFVNLGRYSYIFECGIPSASKSETQICAIVHEFEVTPNGDSSSLDKLYFIMGLLIFFLSTLIFSCYKLFDDKNKSVGLFCLFSVIAYFSLILIFYLLWQTSALYITGIPSLSSILETMFTILLIGTFPLLLGLFVWLIERAMKSAQDQKLEEMGYSKDEISHFRRK